MKHYDYFYRADVAITNYSSRTVSGVITGEIPLTRDTYRQFKDAVITLVKESNPEADNIYSVTFLDIKLLQTRQEEEE